MADRLPLPIVIGLLDGRVGDEWVAARLGVGARVVRVHVTLDLAPGSGKAVDVEIRNAAAGAGSALTASFGAADRDVTATGQLDSNASGEVWMRLGTVTAGAAAMNLSGWIEVEGGAGVTATALTTVDRVKEYAGESGSTNDTLLNRLVLGVSDAIQAHLARSILQSTVTKRFSAPGGLDYLTLPDPPAADNGNLAVSIGRVDDASPTTLTKDEDFELDGEAATLWHLTGTWPRGTRHIQVTWDRGHATVPEALVLAATKQAVYEWRSTFPGGDRIGKQGQILGNGDASYVVRAWAPGILEMIAPYRELI